MLYFPQLLTGAAVQFPFRTSLITRTVANVCADGTAVRMADPGRSRIRWKIAFTALSDEEVRALVTLFEAAEGRLRPFVFLDPAGNLLARTEDMTHPRWSADPLIRISDCSGVPPVPAKVMEITNTAQISQQTKQKVIAPAWFEYTWSVYVRADTAAQVALFAMAGGNVVEQTSGVGPVWRRMELRVSGLGESEEISFGLRVSPGQTIHACGPQIDAQPSASAYVPSVTGGVYPHAHFASDRMQVTTEGPSHHSTDFEIEARLA